MCIPRDDWDAAQKQAQDAALLTAFRIWNDFAECESGQDDDHVVEVIDWFCDDMRRQMRKLKAIIKKDLDAVPPACAPRPTPD